MKDHTHTSYADMQSCAECARGLYGWDGMSIAELTDKHRPATTASILGPTPRQARTTFLESYRPTLIAYLTAKLEAEDRHGVADGAMDLRDLDCELDGLRYPG